MMNLFKRARIKQLFKKAKIYYTNGEFEKAITVYKGIRLIDDRMATAGIALCNYQLQKYEEAIEYIDLTIEIDPYDLRHQFNKVVYLTRLQKLKEALLISNRIMEIEDDNPLYAYQNGQLLASNGYYEKAIEVFEKYLSLTENKKDVYFLLADCYSKLDNRERCIRLYKLVLKEEPNNVVALNNLGYNRMKLGKYKESIIDFDRVLELDNKYSFSYNNKGYACLKLGRLEEAHKLIKRSLELDSKNSYAYKNLSLYYIEIGYKQEAIKNLEIAQKLGFKELYGNEVNELLEKLK